MEFKRWCREKSEESVWLALALHKNKSEVSIVLSHRYLPFESPIGIGPVGVSFVKIILYKSNII
jgi:hypothetical protein